VKNDRCYVDSLWQIFSHHYPYNIKIYIPLPLSIIRHRTLVYFDGQSLTCYGCKKVGRFIQPTSSRQNARKNRRRQLPNRGRILMTGAPGHKLWDALGTEDNMTPLPCRRCSYTGLTQGVNEGDACPLGHPVDRCNYGVDKDIWNIT
jgi:hypothetical protein